MAAIDYAAFATENKRCGENGGFLESAGLAAILHAVLAGTSFNDELKD